MKSGVDMNLIKHIKNFTGKKILVIGDIMLDEYLWGNVERISPEAPVPLVDIERESVSPGGAANVAANILSLGGDPILIGVVGNDIDGERLREVLSDMDIDDSGIFTISGRPTTRKTRVIAEDQHLVRFDREERTDVGEETRREILSFMMERRKEFEAILIEDYDKGLLNKEIIGKIMSDFGDLVITVDPKIENFFYYRNATLFKPNRKELEIAMGKKLLPENIGGIVRELKENLGCKNLVVTLGEEGMFVVGEDGEWEIPHKAKVEVYDAAGAGDTVISALTLSVAAGASIYESALIASYAAGLEVGKVGVVPVKKEELISSVEKDIR